MAMRPLEKLPTIRAKLGSVIVLAVAMTLLISYLLIGFALRNSPKDTEAVRLLALARRFTVEPGARSPRARWWCSVPPTGRGHRPGEPRVGRRMFTDGVPHWGIVQRHRVRVGPRLPTGAA